MASWWVWWFWVHLIRVFLLFLGDFSMCLCLFWVWMLCRGWVWMDLVSGLFDFGMDWFVAGSTESRARLW